MKNKISCSWIFFYMKHSDLISKISKTTFLPKYDLKFKSKYFNYMMLK